ncbi:MAG TPA: GerMN domain-containing protein [Terriglobia bacterium]|nr:GerMN domain-containing protein [Terriglobia bacterium]
MTRRTLIVALIVIPLLIVSGFYLRSLMRRTSRETVARPEAEMSTQLQQQALQTGPTTQQTITLYFPDYDTATLVQETRNIALATTDEDRIRQIVLALVAGSQQNHVQPLPPSTALRAVFLAGDGTAYLDFSTDVTRDFPEGIESETLALRSIVDSLAANISGVRRVKFLVQGQEVDTLDGHADLTGFYTPDFSNPSATTGPPAAAAPAAQ